MGFMKSGRKGPDAPRLPSQPAAAELMDVIDELAGTQTITVVGANGKKRRVTQRLPLTPQEKQTLSQVQNLFSQAVSNIEALYRNDPASVVNYQPFIQTFSNINNERMQDLAQIGNFKDIAEKVEQFRVINRDLAMREFDTNQNMMEENLARRGLSRSTEATELRAAMARERSQLAREVDVSSNNYAQDLKNRQLESETNLYNVRDAGRQARLQEAEAGYNLERQRSDDIQAIRQNNIDENVNLMNIAQGIKGQDMQRAQLALAGNQGAISLLGTQAKNQNQRYANDLARIQGQYRMDSDAAAARPASFGQRIRDLAVGSAGSYIGGVASGFMGGATPAAAGVSFGQRLRG